MGPLVKSATMQASQAILRPAQLTPEQYRLLTDPFRLEGIHIPPHPDEDPSDGEPS